MYIEIIIGLLAVVALAEIYRLSVTARPFTKKDHFKSKLVGTQKLIWDLEFKRHKTLEIREGVRKEYDFMLSRVASIEDAIKNFKGEEGDKARLTDDLERAQKDADRLKGQLRQIDAEVHGEQPSAENHSGTIGITEQIDSYRELRDMLKSWVRGGCK